MEKKQIEILKKIIKEEEKKGDYDLNDSLMYFWDEDELKDIKDVDELQDYLLDLDNDSGLTNIEIIYYSKAMEFLSEYDPSLNESMGVASGLGYTPEQINSELLASLLASEQARESFVQLIDSIISRDDEIFEGEGENE